MKASDISAQGASEFGLSFFKYIIPELIFENKSKLLPGAESSVRLDATTVKRGLYSRRFGFKGLGV